MLHSCQLDFKLGVIVYHPGVSIFRSSGTTGLVTMFNLVVVVLILK